jgi:hypothetical protein
MWVQDLVSDELWAAAGAVTQWPMEDLFGD